MSRLLDYGRVLGTHISDASEAAAQSVKLLANVVGRQAFVLAYIDGFQAAAAVAAICWILAAFVASGLSSKTKTDDPNEKT
jgi:MFS transporter, DHA2 family, multidrug resistance protein